MIKKRYLILIFCIISILSMQFVSANDNTDDINVLGVSGEESILQAPSETQSYTDLNTVINQAGEGDEINLTYNYEYRNGNDPKTGINITKNLVINGNGATINGNDVSSLFNISEGVTVTLKNLTIIKAAYKEGWAADTFVAYPAITSKGTLNIEDCTFDSNKPALDWLEHVENVNGSVIYSTGDVNILNSVFSNNWVQTSAIIYTTGRVSVKGSEFENNIAYGDNYKGAVIYTEGGIDLIDDCTFYLNGKDGKGSGGAIYIANPNAVTSIKDSSIDYNFAKNGGAIYTEGIIDSIVDSTFEGDLASAGGVIYAKAVNTIDGSSFEECGYYIQETSKGAIYITGSDDLVITDSTFSSCQAGEGGAIYTHGGVSLINSEITGCLADSFNVVTKGAVYANGDVYIEETSITDNFALEGSAVYSNSSITIINCNDIEGNGKYGQHVTSKGGVFYAKGDVNIENTIFGENYANLAGGAVYSEGNVNFYNSKVNGSAATINNGDGGFIYAKGNVNVENATISDVYMKVGDQGKEFSGAVYAGGDMIIRNATFDHINKEHHSYGGAICVLGNVVIYNSNFTNNQAVLYAAGYVNGTLDIYDCIFTNNSDGAIFSEGNAVVNSTKFINNTITGSAMYGIAIGSNGTLNLTNSYVYGSNARDSNYRGSVFSKNNLYVENCTFDEIHSEAGTATGMIISTKSNASVINTEFLDFSYHGSTIYGGSIYAGVNAYVENCTFFNATLVNQNGQTHGLCIYSEENITLYNSNLIDIDSSNGQNGAVKGGNYVYVFNSTFINITGARSSGGAIYANVANVTNSSFYRILCSDNADKGGAIYANDTYVYYNNFTNCHAGTGGAIYSLNYTTAIENIFINNSNQYSGGAIYTKNGFIEYNVILENMGNTWNLPADIAIVDGVVDSLEYNWWGENVPFGTPDKQKRAQVNVQSSQGTYFVPDTWVIMDFYITNPLEPVIGQGVNLTTALERYYNNTTHTYHKLAHNIAKRTVYYNATNNVTGVVEGTFSHDSAPIINRDYVMYSNNNFENHSVSSTIDYQTLYLDVTAFTMNLTKTVTNDTPKVGDIINYTITISNIDTTHYAPDTHYTEPPIMNITITDVLDDRLQLLAVNGTPCSNKTVIWYIENMHVNTTHTLILKVRVRGTGNITNIASITKVNGTELKNPYNGTNVTIYVNGSTFVELNVTKTANATNIYVGDKVEFTIAVNNTGTSNATNVKVWDILPAGFEWVSGGHYDTSTRNVTFDAVDIESGKTVSFNFVVRAMADGKLNNTAFAHADENETIFNGTSDNITVNPDVRLNVTKTVVGGVTEVYVGDSIVYEITVTNNGNSTATGVNVTEKLSDLVVVTGASDASWNNITKVWNVGTLASEESKTLRLTVRVKGNGTVANAVVANSTENTTDVPANSTNVTAKPDVRLSIDKTITSDVTNVHVGDSIVYVITVTNNGNSTATKVNVTETLSNLVVVTGADTGGAGSWNNDTKVWNIPSIAGNGGSASLTLTVRVIGVGTVTNAVVAKASENDTEVTDDAPDVDVKPDVKLSITKDLVTTGPIYAGDNITYTIVITNNGLSEATNVNVTDIVKGNGDIVKCVDADSGKSYTGDNWIIDSIAAGGHVTLTVTVHVTAEGAVANNVTGKSGENDTPVSDETPEVDVLPDVKLNITKTVVGEVSEVYVGDEIVYNITVTNNGISNATDVSISEKLSDLVVVTGASDAGWNNVTKVWNVDTLAAGESKSLLLTVKVINNGTVANAVVGRSNENTTDVPANSTNVTALPDVRLNITKTANVSYAKVGDNVKFTIVVTNNGLSDATNVAVSDVLDKAFGYVEGGSYDAAARSVSWNIDRIEAGKSAEVYVIVNLMTDGTFANVASAYAEENTTEVTGTSDNITVRPEIVWSIIKEADVSTAYIGDLINFTITVFNNGPSNATEVAIDDILNVDFEIVDASEGYWVYNLNNIQWDIPEIKSGAGYSVWVLVRAKNNGTYVNWAHVSSDESRIATSNKTSVTVLPVVDVAIDLSVDNATPDINGIVVLNLTLKNNGPSTATQIVGNLTGDFLTGLEIISIDSEGIIFHSSDLLSYALSDILRVNEDGTFEVDYLAPGQEVSAAIKARVIRDGNLVIKGDVSEHEKDSNLSNNHDEVTLYVHSLVDLTVEKSVNETNPTVGDVIEYTITVVNKGPSNATGTVVNEKLPDGVVYVSDNSEGKYNPTTGVWNVGELQANQTAILTVKVKVSKVGEITNLVDVNSTQDNTNPDGAKDNVTINVKDLDRVDIKVTKSVNTTTPYLGDLVVYTITISNIGNTTATGVVVYENLIDGLRFVSDDGNGQYYFNYGIWDIGVLEPGETRVLNIVVQVTKLGEITNFVIVDCEQEFVNDNSTYDNVTIFVVEHPEPEDNDTVVPHKADVRLKETGNPIMMILMVLLSVGVCVIRRKQ